MEVVVRIVYRVTRSDEERQTLREIQRGKERRNVGCAPTFFFLRMKIARVAASRMQPLHRC